MDDLQGDSRNGLKLVVRWIGFIRATRGDNLRISSKTGCTDNATIVIFLGWVRRVDSSEIY